MDLDNTNLINTVIWGQPIVLSYWKVFGLVGVSLFSGRWLVQMYYSRKAGKPVTPRLFWVLSILGSSMTLAYFTFSPKQDMVGILGNSFPCVIAAYNLYLDITHRRKTEAEIQLAKSSGEFTATVGQPEVPTHGEPRGSSKRGDVAGLPAAVPPPNA